MNQLFTSIYLLAPIPRPPRPSEKQYITILADGTISTPQLLPCWFDQHVPLRELARKGLVKGEIAYRIEAAEVSMSVIVPAYNEEARMTDMLEEAVEYLQTNDWDQRAKGASDGSLQANGTPAAVRRDWEILVVSDGSTDKTIQTALEFAKKHQRNMHAAEKGPWNGALTHGNIPTGSIRVVQLVENRGKGGAVTHGMRHARGDYVVFADADGASNFNDLGKLVSACDGVRDSKGRAVGIGSRAHMVGTEAVVQVCRYQSLLFSLLTSSQRSLLRNTLMRAFHLLIRTLTTRKTGQIKDTQCGFKLFTRPSLPYIIPYMHSEGWIFDVEMLMLAESADIPMIEVPIGWHEVNGSKLNVIKDSIGMAIGLAMLRIGWGLGIYRID